MAISRDGVRELGIPEMDQDHHRLIEMVNGDWLLPIAAIIVRLEEIAQETQRHFEREERLMEIRCFPESAEHKAEHEDLIVEVSDVIARLKAGLKVSTETVVVYTLHWIIEHINTMDSKLAVFLLQSDGAV